MPLTNNLPSSASPAVILTLHTVLHGSLRTMLICLLVVLICTQTHAGFMIHFFTWPALLYQLIQLYRKRRERGEVARRLFRIGLIVMASGIVAGVVIHAHLSARAKAEMIRAEITGFKTTRQHYPASLAVISPALEALAKKQRVFYRLGEDGMPWLFYPVTYGPFDTWDYDFSAQTWRYAAH